MAFANPVLVLALRETAHRLREGAPYAWGHHGRCNCGHLAQKVSDIFLAKVGHDISASIRGSMKGDHFRLRMRENHCFIKTTGFVPVFSSASTFTQYNPAG